MKEILSFFKADIIIVLILGIALCITTPDLQAQIIAGLVGYLGGSSYDRYIK